MRKIVIAVGVILSISACKKLEDLNIDKKNASEVPSATLFSNAQKNLMDQVYTPLVNNNVLRLFAQQWTETTYTDESNYNITTRKIPDTEFRVIYRDVLADLKEAARLVPLESDLISTTAEKKNRLAIIEILNVYAYQRLIDLFGNIPYEKALDIENILPAYDDAEKIYGKLFDRLDKAIADLNTGANSFKEADIIYEGNAASWKLFANSLKLKMAITVADVPSLNPSARAADAVAKGVFTTMNQSAFFAYQVVTANTSNPVWAQLVNSGRHDYVVTNTMVDKLIALNDPRLKMYCDSNLRDKNNNVIYEGGPYGDNNDYKAYSHVALSLQKKDSKGILLDYTEVLFYQAEAAARGFIAGTPQTYYDKGITSSILFWGGTDADVISYLANPAVNYLTATGTFKEKIATQAWIAYFNRGDIGWTTWRRLDAPKLNPPSGMTNANIPVRYTYPISEQTVNGANYTAAAAAIGGDTQATKLFWDKN